MYARCDCKDLFSIVEFKMDSSLRCWLLYVDNNLTPQAVNFLKLGLHSELSRYYSEVQMLDKPSDIYSLLLRCMGNSNTDALQMFIHVVRGLGVTLRGVAVVEAAFDDFNLENSGPFDMQKASPDFKFFQCLLQIAVKTSKNGKLKEKLKIKFCTNHYLKKHHIYINCLSELFIELYQNQFIKANDTELLVHVFSKYEVEQSMRTEARECLKILNLYHESVGLEPIDLISSAEATFFGK